jgi:hypothetical protein
LKRFKIESFQNVMAEGAAVTSAEQANRQSPRVIHHKAGSSGGSPSADEIKRPAEGGTT